MDPTLRVVEMEMPAGSAGPPLLVHPTHGEGCYVLAGDLTFQIGDQIVSGGPGTWVFAPRYTPHTLANYSDQDGRLLCVFAPAGFERRFERMIAQQTGQPVPDEPSEAEQATRMIGPPLSAPAATREAERSTVAQLLRAPAMCCRDHGQQFTPGRAAFIRQRVGTARLRCPTDLPTRSADRLDR